MQHIGSERTLIGQIVRCYGCNIVHLQLQRYSHLYIEHAGRNIVGHKTDTAVVRGLSAKSHWDKAVANEIYRHHRCLCQTSQDACIVNLTSLDLIFFLIFLLAEDKTIYPTETTLNLAYNAQLTECRLGFALFLFYLALFLVELLLGFFNSSPDGSLLLLGTLIEEISTRRQGRHQLTISKDYGCTTLLNNDTFQFLNLLELGLLYLTRNLARLYIPDNTSAYNIYAIDSLHCTTVARTLGFALGTLLGKFSIALRILGTLYLALCGTSLLVYSSLLFTLYIAIHLSACYGIGNSTYTIGKPSFLTCSCCGLCHRRTAFHTEFHTGFNLCTTFGTNICRHTLLSRLCSKRCTTSHTEFHTGFNLFATLGTNITHLFLVHLRWSGSSTLHTKLITGINFTTAFSTLCHNISVYVINIQFKAIHNKMNLGR